METTLRARIRERLTALNMTAVEASRRLGVDRSYVAELLRGKKETIRPARLTELAGVLDCDPDYLTGAQPVPRLTDAAPGTTPLAGIVEAGAWRGADAEPRGEALPIQPDPRFASGRQAAYLVRGHHADALGLRDGDVLLVVADVPIRDGDIVVVRQVRDGGERELAARLVERGELRARAGVSLNPTQNVDGAQIMGRVILSYRVF